MEASQVYILIAVIVLLIIAVLVFFGRKKKGKKEKRLTPLAGLAFGFVVAGIVFGDNRLVGYSLIGIGVALALTDMIVKFREKKGKR